MMLGVKLAVAIFSPLEQLNRSLQAKDATVTGMLEAREKVIVELSCLRNETELQSIMADVEQCVITDDLDKLILPRVGHPPS